VRALKALGGGERPVLRLGFTPGKKAASSHLLGGSVSPRASLDALEKRPDLCLNRDSNVYPIG